MKVDAKTKTLLDDYRKKKKGIKDDKTENGDDDGKKEEDVEEEMEKLDEFTMREDRVAKAGLDAIMKEYASDLAKPVGRYKGTKRETFLSLYKFTI